MVISNQPVLCCCGAGVVGLTAAALGASEVVLTDRPHLIKHINSNIQVWALPGITSCTQEQLQTNAQQRYRQLDMGW